MDPVHKAVLRKHRVYLSGELLVCDTIVPFLFQEEVLTEAQVEDIESLATNRLKALRLLDLLPTRGPRAFHCFLRSLEDFSWARDRLQLELQTPPEPGSTGISYPTTAGHDENRTKWIRMKAGSGLRGETRSRSRSTEGLSERMFPAVTVNLGHTENSASHL
ncbi:death domain-containing protein CRADD isoform X3 [Trachinotus anak]